MNQKQQGASGITIIILIFLSIWFGVFFIKAIPAYAEYYTVKKTLKQLMTQDLTPYELKEKFRNQSMISSIPSISVDDLSMESNNGVVSEVSVGYRRNAPVIKNIGIYFDFDVKVSKGQN